MKSKQSIIDEGDWFGIVVLVIGDTIDIEDLNTLSNYHTKLLFKSKKDIEFHGIGWDSMKYFNL